MVAHYLMKFQSFFTSNKYSGAACFNTEMQVQVALAFKLHSLYCPMSKRKIWNSGGMGTRTERERPANEGANNDFHDSQDITLS